MNLTEESKNMQKTLPDKNGHFGIFGGRYAADKLWRQSPLKSPKRSEAEALLLAQFKSPIILTLV